MLSNAIKLFTCHVMEIFLIVKLKMHPWVDWLIWFMLSGFLGLCLWLSLPRMNFILLRAMGMVVFTQKCTCGWPPRNKEITKSLQVQMLPVQPFDNGLYLEQLSCESSTCQLDKQMQSWQVEWVLLVWLNCSSENSCLNSLLSLMHSTCIGCLG